MIKIAVMGHRERESQAELLASLCSAELLLDDGSLGENANGDRAWQAVDGHSGDWGVVLQDDALPVEGFVGHLEAALTSAPSPVVSLYLGTSYPPRIQPAVRRATAEADVARAGWIMARSLFWGVGVALRGDLIAHMLRYVARVGLPYDQRISRWAWKRHKVSYTWPCLVDHADGRSLIQRQWDRSKARRAHRVGVAESWARSIKL